MSHLQKFPICVNGSFLMIYARCTPGFGTFVGIRWFLYQGVCPTYARFLAVDIAKLNWKGLCIYPAYTRVSLVWDLLAYTWYKWSYLAYSCYMRYFLKEELVHLFTKVILILKMAHRGWVKNSLPPSQQLTVLSSPITKSTTKTMDALAPLIMSSKARLQLPPSPYCIAL